MKKYFTKYLPVEDEAKEGDIVYWTDPDGNLSSGLYSVINSTEGLMLIGSKTSEAEVPPSECKLVKLFLCSQDIQVGDRFNSANGTGFLCDRIEAEKLYSIGGLRSELEEVPHNRDHSYKVIGEVSAGAIWVTEGMEFDSSEVLIINKQRGNEFVPVVEIKCSQCKTYH